MKAAGASVPSDIVWTYTLPAAPSSLSANVFSDTQIDLSWSDNSAGETKQLIEFSAHGGRWRPLATVPADATSHSVTGLAEGTPYAFRVKAANLSGESEPSNTATATTTDSDPSQDPPVVNVSATTPQAAEGSSTPGQFTVHRDGGDASAPLTVNYAVSNCTNPYTLQCGYATGGSDYTALSGSVTIPAGERSATIDVNASADSNTEEVEPVGITLSANVNYQVGPQNQAEVDVLDKKKLLVAFFGAGPNDLTANNFIIGNTWLLEVAREAERINAYQPPIIKDHTEGGDALDEFFQTVNADDKKSISQAEADSVELGVVGYSWGGIQAVNFTFHLNRQGDRIAGFLLEAPVPVKTLVTLDPVNNKQTLKKTRDAVQANVAKLTNYHQRRADDSFVAIFTRPPERVFQRHHLIKDGVLNLVGSTIVVVAGVQKTEIRVENDVVTAGEKAAHDFFEKPADNPEWGELLGKDVNHGTLPWWAFDRAVAALA